MGHKLSLQKLAFSRILSRDLGLWACAACYIRGIVENLAAYTAPFQIADAALHLTGVKKTCPIHLKIQGSVEVMKNFYQATHG